MLPLKSVSFGITKPFFLSVPQMKDYFNFVDDGYLNSSVIFIVLGVIILVVGFFGCCGACTENSCMMTTFSLLLAVVVAIQVQKLKMTKLMKVRRLCEARWLVPNQTLLL